MSEILIGIIRIYQRLISPLFPGCCRFYPNCSNFSVEAIGKYGAILGFYCTVRRITRCHPLCSGGIDPVEKYENDKGFICLKKVIKYTQDFFRRWILHQV